MTTKNSNYESSLEKFEKVSSLKRKIEEKNSDIAYLGIEKERYDKMLNEYERKVESIGDSVSEMIEESDYKQYWGHIREIAMDKGYYTIKNIIEDLITGLANRIEEAEAEVGALKEQFSALIQ
jgi:regulator of replication initiation timing